MSEINWERHPTATDATVEFFDASGGYAGFKKLKRPQTKTVADAYEWANGEWQKGRETIWLSKSSNALEWGDNVTKDTVCTHEQFEAYAKEQEGEKWTHEYNGDKCKIIHQADWQAWIKSKGGLSKLVPVSELRKPKPTIKPSSAWMLVSKKGWTVNGVIETYDVEEVPAND